MTQPTEAVGAATNDTVVAAEPTLEDRFAAISGDIQENPPEEDQIEAAPAAETELTPEDVTDVEADAEAETEAPPITPPVSWTAEEKEEFSNLPRALQETLTRREAEREKFVQGKAQEAAKTQSRVEQQAIGIIQNLQNTHAQQLQALLPQIPDRPSHLLQVEDPYTYAAMMEAHENALAQHQYVQQVIQGITQQQGQTEQAVKAQQDQQTQELLQAQFPEFLDPAKGAEIKQQLASTALALGYSNDQLANVDAQDILAMKQASEWKAKADKFDTLMAKKMETVREAKNLPRVSRPGQPQRGAVANERYQADRQAMRNGDKDAGARVFAQFLK